MGDDTHSNKDPSSPKLAIAMGLCVGVSLTVLMVVVVMRIQNKKKEQYKAVDAIDVPDQSKADEVSMVTEMTAEV